MFVGSSIIWFIVDVVVINSSRWKIYILEKNIYLVLLKMNNSLNINQQIYIKNKMDPLLGKMTRNQDQDLDQKAKMEDKQKLILQ